MLRYDRCTYSTDTKMATKKTEVTTQTAEPDRLVCGIVMPLSVCDGCSEEHWRDVREILDEAITSADFNPNLVSSATDVGVIHKRIIENLYDNPVVVCDVSGRNPNVMLELGIRLAFDKPTILVKDDKTPFSFDTSPIEHLQYPRDLRFGQIVEFKEELADKIKRTHKRAVSDPNYTTFLKHFGTFKVAKLQKEEVSSEIFILDELKALRNTVQLLAGSNSPGNTPADSENPLIAKRPPTLCFRETTQEHFDAAIAALIKSDLMPKTFSARETAPGHFHITLSRRSEIMPKLERAELLKLAKGVVPNTRWLS
jgi:hypothetical protein